MHLSVALLTTVHLYLNPVRFLRYHSYLLITEVLHARQQIGKSHLHSLQRNHIIIGLLLWCAHDTMKDCLACYPGKSCTCKSSSAICPSPWLFERSHKLNRMVKACSLQAYIGQPAEYKNWEITSQLYKTLVHKGHIWSIFRAVLVAAWKVVEALECRTSVNRWSTMVNMDSVGRTAYFRAVSRSLDYLQYLRYHFLLALPLSGTQVSLWT